MPVFDIAESMRNTPVGVNPFTRGKAMRIAMRAQEAQAALHEKEVEHYDRKVESNLRHQGAETDLLEQQVAWYGFAQGTERLKATASVTNAVNAQNASERERTLGTAKGVKSLLSQGAALPDVVEFLYSQGETDEEVEMFLSQADGPLGLVGITDAIIAAEVDSSYFAQKDRDVADEIAKEDREGKAVNIVLPGGTVVAGIERHQGQLFLQDGTTPAPEGSALSEKISSSGSGTSRARAIKIRDLQNFWGVDLPTAQAMTDGYIKTEINDKTGKVLMTNEITGHITELPISSLEEAAIPENSGVSLWDMTQYGTGFGSGLRDLWNAVPVLGQLSPAKKTQFARQTLETHTNPLIRAMALSDRYAVGEQSRIMEQIRTLPQWFDNPVAMRVRMIAIHDFLVEESAHWRRVEADPNEGDEERRLASKSATAMERFLGVMAPSRPEELSGDYFFTWSLTEQDSLEIWETKDPNVDPKMRRVKVNRHD